MRGLVSILFAFVLIVPTLADDSKLSGTWKLKRWVLEDIETKEQKPSPFGERPTGYVIFAPSSRLFALITAEDRKAPIDADAQSAAFRTMYAYSGKYRIESDRFITKVDIAGDQRWIGTEQQRSFRFEDQNLVIESPATAQDGRKVRAILEWEREK
jgi:purine nucleoside permease